MSQGDYIKYKKTSNMINDLKKMPSIIEQGQYLSFNQYSVEKINKSSKLTYNKLSSGSDYVNIFGTERNVKICDKYNNYVCPYLNSGLNAPPANRGNYKKVNQIGNSPVRPYLINKKLAKPKISCLPECIYTKY